MTQGQVRWRPEVRAALLGGIFNQVRKRLRSSSAGDACYCVQGVLCELYRRAHPERAAWTHWNGAVSRHGEVFTLLGDQGQARRSPLHAPDEVLTWAGVPTSFPGGRRGRSVLEELNDARQLDFAGIVCWLDQHGDVQ